LTCIPCVRSVALVFRTLTCSLGPGPIPPGIMAGGDSQVDYTFKTIIIGESNAGKSSLLQQFINGRLNEVSKHTVGVEFGSRTIALPAEDASGSGGTSVVKLQIWDTAGQDRFRSVTRSYYRGAVACMVVFSLADRASFDKLPQWLSDAKTQARSDITILIVGNKADLDDERQVSMIEASKLAQSEGCSYMETSARTGENVESAFFKLSRSVLAKVQDGKLDAASLASRSAPLKKEPAAAAEAAASGCSC